MQITVDDRVVMIDVWIYKMRMTERRKRPAVLAVRLLDILLHVGMMVRIDDLGVVTNVLDLVVRLMVEHGQLLAVRWHLLDQLGVSLLGDHLLDGLVSEVVDLGD